MPAGEGGVGIHVPRAPENAVGTGFPSVRARVRQCESDEYKNDVSLRRLARASSKVMVFRALV